MLLADGFPAVVEPVEVFLAGIRLFVDVGIGDAFFAVDDLLLLGCDGGFFCAFVRGRRACRRLVGLLLRCASRYAAERAGKASRDYRDFAFDRHMSPLLYHVTTVFRPCLRLIIPLSFLPLETKARVGRGAR